MPQPTSLRPLTSAAITEGATLTVSRNFRQSFTAELKWPYGGLIAGTMPTPDEAVTQLEQALIHERSNATMAAGEA